MNRLSTLLRASRGVAAKSLGGVRLLNLHEYQSKLLLERHHVTCQKGKSATTPDEAKEIAKWILKENPSAELIVKAQVHTGGRGKGHFDSGLKGGVKICKTPEDAASLAKQMIGYKIFTKQTGEAGQQCHRVLINEGVDIDKEFYFAILMDRATGGPVMIASKQGGVEIEEVAHSHPESIFREPIDLKQGLTARQAEKMAKRLGIPDAIVGQGAQQMMNLYDLFIKNDSTQVEINPFAIAHVPGFPSKMYCVDAKLNFDDDAKFRNKELHAMRDYTQEDPRDVAASKLGVNYIGLDGTIGCMVNGAGLAMATMDIIDLHGGRPANFLDVGGSSTVDSVCKSLQVIIEDSRVRSILINIFGGINRCDVIAEGISQALDILNHDPKTAGRVPPLVVRLEGTNVKKGLEILAKCPYKVLQATDLDDAAEKAVAAAK